MCQTGLLAWGFLNFLLRKNIQLYFMLFTWVVPLLCVFHTLSAAQVRLRVLNKISVWQRKRNLQKLICPYF